MHKMINLGSDAYTVYRLHACPVYKTCHRPWKWTLSNSINTAHYNNTGLCTSAVYVYIRSMCTHLFSYVCTRYTSAGSWTHALVSKSVCT